MIDIKQPFLHHIYTRNHRISMTSMKTFVEDKKAEPLNLYFISNENNLIHGE